MIAITIATTTTGAKAEPSPRLTETPVNKTEWSGILCFPPDLNSQSPWVMDDGQTGSLRRMDVVELQ